MTTPRKVPPPDTDAAVLGRRGGSLLLDLSLPKFDYMVEKYHAPRIDIGTNGRKHLRFLRDDLLEWFRSLSATE